MKTLVVVDHNNNKLEKSTLNTIKAAIQLENVDLLVLSDSCKDCLLYTSPSPRDRTRSRMPSSA